MTNKNSTSSECVINEFPYWLANYFQSVVPKGYQVIECVRSWPQAMPLLTKSLEKSGMKKSKSQKYKAEFIDSKIPKFYAGLIRPVWKTTKKSLDRDSSYWEYLESRQLEKLNIKYADWFGIIKFSKGKKSAYFCQANAGLGRNAEVLAFAAFKDKKFFEELLVDFDSEARKTVEVQRKKIIFCPNGPDINMEKVDLDRVILPKELKNDIISSTETFFKRIDSFKGMGVPSKRGFLLTGEPGNGKTLFCFALVGHIAAKFNVKIATLRVDRQLDNNDVTGLYEWASKHGPSIVILEDVDTILTETGVTRSGFLNVLDGLRTERGILTIATTNYPERLDPALAHRPSRFDRVWQIPTPNKDQRDQFIVKLFQESKLNEEIRKNIVTKTNGWSMAYIQELKATAVVSAVQNDRDHLDAEDFSYALDKLSAQFSRGKKNHRYESGEGTGLGFFE